MKFQGKVGPRMKPYIFRISHYGETKQAEKISMISMLFFLDEIPKASFKSFSAVVTLESCIHLSPKNQRLYKSEPFCNETFSSFWRDQTINQCQKNQFSRRDLNKMSSWNKLNLNRPNLKQRNLLSHAKLKKGQDDCINESILRELRMCELSDPVIVKH